MDTLLFTPASLLDLLSQIDELKDLNLNITEGFDGELQLTVGDSSYIISSDRSIDIEVGEEVVEKVEDVNYQAYDDLDPGTFDVATPVESGILKEIAKTLFVGGLVRLTGKILRGRK